MLADRDRADAGTAAAVRDAEGLVQVQVGHVGAEPARLGEAEQRVEVRTVDIDLSAGVVHLGAELGDASLVDTVGGRVGDHDGGQLVAVLLDAPVQVDQVDVAVGVAGHDDHPHAGHHRAGRVGAVGAGRDQADVAVGLPVRPVVAPDGQQPGQFTLRSGVGLHADRVVPGQFGQPRLQVVDQLGVARGLRRAGRTGACWPVPAR